MIAPAASIPGADPDAEFERYAETGAVPVSADPYADSDDGPDPQRTPDAASRPELTLLNVPHKIETVVFERVVYELRLLHTYPMGVQVGLGTAYNTVLAFVRREQDPFIWPPLPVPEPEPLAEDADADAIPPALRTGPLDHDEELQRRFLLERIAEYATPTLPADVRKRIDLPELETLAMRFFSRSREIRAEAEIAASRPTSDASSPGSNGSTEATSTRGSGATTPASSTPAPTNLARSKRKNASGN